MEREPFAIETAPDSMVFATDSRTLRRGLELLQTQTLVPVDSRRIYQHGNQILILEHAKTSLANTKGLPKCDFALHFFENVSCEYKKTVPFRVNRVQGKVDYLDDFNCHKFGFLDSLLYLCEPSRSGKHFIEHVFDLAGTPLAVLSNDPQAAVHFKQLFKAVPTTFLDPSKVPVVTLTNLHSGNMRFVSAEPRYPTLGDTSVRRKWILYDRRLLAKRLLNRAGRFSPWPQPFDWHLANDASKYQSDNEGIWSIEWNGVVTFNTVSFGSNRRESVITGKLPIDPSKVLLRPVLGGSKELLLEVEELEDFRWTGKKPDSYYYCWIDQNQALQYESVSISFPLSKLRNDGYDIWFTHPETLFNGIAVFAAPLEPTGQKDVLSEVVLVLNMREGTFRYFELRVPKSQSATAQNMVAPAGSASSTMPK